MDYFTISSVYLLLETFFMISLRIFGFFVVVPIFGGQGTNNMVKISISLLTALILMTSQNITMATDSSRSILMYFGMGLKELAVGLIIGFVVYFLLTVFYYVGQLVDFQIGFSMVSVFDPINQLQVPISGNLFYLTVTMLLVLSGAHHNFFRALFYSYTVLPIGASVIASEQLYHVLLGLFGTFFVLGFTTALPIVGTILVLEIALGILNKAVSQMNIFSIGMSLKIVVGLLILVIVFPMFGNIAEGVFLEINRSLYNVIGGMMP